MNNIAKTITTVFMLILMLFSGTNYALASAWWGEGARSTEWVVSHGGTVIFFDFKGVKGDDKDLKINLYTANGDVIETERGDKKGKIDDGIAGQAYYLKAKDGGKSAKSKVFTMQRGSKNYATVDMKGKKIDLSLGGALATPKKSVAKKPEVKRSASEDRPPLKKGELDYDYLVAPVTGPLVGKEDINKRPGATIDPKLIGKTSREKRDYNLAYDYYKINYKKIRDGKFELKIFTLRDESQEGVKKVAKNK